MKIGIFGGTFNPLHKGHIEILKKIKLKINLDLVFIIPTFKTPDKTFDVELISPRHRYNMIKEALKDVKQDYWINLSNVEINRRGTSYTIDTIKYFKNKYPNDDLFLIMGDDRYVGFDKWKDFSEIKELSRIVVYRRDGIYDPFLEREEDIIFIKDTLYDYSSTKIIKDLELEKMYKHELKYITKHRLYLKKMVFYKLYGERYDHSLSVASHAKRLAIKNNYRYPEKAYLAGLMHDLFKLEQESKMIDYIAKHSTYEIPPIPAIHGYMAALWLRDIYKLKDKQIFEAIRKHTIPDDNMSKLDKIVYTADKIANNRKGKDIAHIRKMAYYDLDNTFAKLLKMQVEKLNSRGIEIDETTKSAYDKYVKKIFNKNFLNNR